MATHLWPKPNIFSLRFLTPSRKGPILSTLPMRSSMRSTASLAPPCSGPYSAPTAPAWRPHASVLDCVHCVQGLHTVKAGLTSKGIAARQGPRRA